MAVIITGTVVLEACQPPIADGIREQLQIDAAKVVEPEVVKTRAEEASHEGEENIDR